MKKKNGKSVLARILSAALIVQLVAGVSVQSYAAPVSDGDSTTTSLSPIFDPDYAELIGRSDIEYEGSISSGTKGFSVANGRLGGPVWQYNNSTLTMQINHTSVFMFNDASAASKDHLNSGGGGIGRIHVNFGSDIFGEDTVNYLSLYEGRLDVTTPEVDVEVLPNMDSDAIILRITDNRENPQDITIDLTMLRDANQVWGAHTATSTLTQVNDNTAVLDQVIQEPCDTGIEINDYYNHAAIAATVQDRSVSSITNSKVGNRESMKLTVPAQQGSFTIVVGGDASMDEADDVKGNAIANATESPSYADVSAESAAWWADFWQKSYIYLPSQQHFEQRRNYYMYLAAISNRGSYPSKYNGGIWLGEEDTRNWGSFYWNWNQDSLYQSLMAANHVELMDPLFEMRESSYDQYVTAAEQMWGSEGIFIGETTGVLGWETLPDDVAESVQEYYNSVNTDNELPRSQAFTDMTKRRNTYLPVWNWNVFGWSDNQASYVTHTMMATQETAEYYWQRYCYTKDLDWLRDYGYKFIKGAAELYRTYDGFVKEDDGYYHIYNTNLHEHIWAGKDVIDDLSMARGTFSAVVKASELLGVDEDLREEWIDIRDHIAPYPLRTDEGAVWAGSTDSSLISKLETDEPAFAQGLSPYYFIRDLQGTESPIFKMLEKYDVLNLETRDQGLDDGAWEIALNTYYHSPGYLNQFEGTKVDQNGSSRFHVDVAKLGLGDDLGRILNTQYHVFTVNGENPNLIFDQADYYSAEGYGTFSAALQDGLNQSIAPTTDGDPVIRVFPAWPKAWDAKYKLLAKDGFLVSSSIESEEIQYVEIESQLGETCRIRNPWDSNVVLYRNGVKAETIEASENDLMEFETSENEIIVLVKEGTDPDQYRTSELKTVNYHIINDTESNIVYTGTWEYSEDRTDREDYLDDVHYTTEDGASVEYTFTGNGVEFITETGPDMGEVDVYIDGELKTTIDCYSATNISYQQSAYRNAGLKYVYTTGSSGYQGRHTIKLVKKSGNVMMLDGLKILTQMGATEYDPDNVGDKTIYINDNDLDSITYVNGSGATDQYNGAWFYTTNRAGEGAYMNDAHICGNSSEAGAGNYCEITFTGTGITYLTEKNDDMGDVRVYLDGEDQGTVSCYKTGGRLSREPVYSVSGLENTQHTLRLEKVSGQYMIVDYFEVTVPTDLGDITGITITQQPTLLYTEGQALDLSAMKITATYADGAERILGYDDEGISVSISGGEAISHGAIMTKDYDSKTLTIQYGEQTAETEPLQVGFESVMVDDTDSSVTYTGSTWSAETEKEGAYQGTLNTATADGDSVEVAFTGMGISFVTEQNENMGKVDVYIDGVLRATVDCYAEAPGQSQYSAYTVLGLENGEHTLKLVKTSGNAMVVDAFQIWGVSEQKALSSITVEGPDKTEYELGEELDLTGLTVVANYSDGTTETVTGYEVSGFDSTAAGEKTVTVTYQDKTATFTVTVKEAAEPVDKWILQSMYEYALTCSTEGVVDSAKEYFEKVLAEAEAVLNDPAATEEDVDTAWQNLLEGIWGLGIVQGDKTNLLKLIEAAEAMVENEDKYVTTNWQQLLDALEAAKAVADNGDALDEDIQPAEEALLNAMVLQRYKANKANLQELVEKVQTMDLTVYTDESVAVLQNVLKAAVMVLDDETLSIDDQKVVDQAEIELLSAVEDLELKEDTTTTEPENPDEDTQQPDDTTKPDTQPSEGDNAQEAPATGDSFGYAGMMLLIVVLCGSGMAMALLVYMRKRQAR